MFVKNLTRGGQCARAGKRQALALKGHLQGWAGQLAAFMSLLSGYLFVCTSPPALSLSHIINPCIAASLSCCPSCYCYLYINTYSFFFIVNIFLFKYLSPFMCLTFYAHERSMVLTVMPIKTLFVWPLSYNISLR